MAWEASKPGQPSKRARILGQQEFFSKPGQLSKRARILGQPSATGTVAKDRDSQKIGTKRSGQPSKSNSRTNSGTPIKSPIPNTHQTGNSGTPITGTPGHPSTGTPGHPSKPETRTGTPAGTPGHPSNPDGNSGTPIKSRIPNTRTPGHPSNCRQLRDTHQILARANSVTPIKSWQA